MSTRPAEHRVLSLGWWLRDSEGRVVVVQWPNSALWVWIAALLVRWTGAVDSHRVALTGVARGALIVWALDEVIRGVNPFRRLVGALVLTTQLAIFA